MKMGILFTNKCNASCDHCSTDCGPGGKDRLSLEEILRVIDEGVGLADGRKPQFCISGGEPFLYWLELLEMVRYGHARGATMTCVSNGFWGRDEQVAREKAQQLKEAGLVGLALSTSDYHQKFVPLASVANAIAAAKTAGLVVILKFPYTKSGMQPDDMKALLGRELLEGVILEIFSVLPHVRTGQVVSENELITSSGIPRGTCPMPIVTIREDGQAYTCCIPGGFIPPLRLGNIRDDKLSSIKKRFDLGNIQSVLVNEGPGFLADGIVAIGKSNLLRTHYTSVCDLCTHLLGNQETEIAAQQIAEAYQLSRLETAVRALIEECEESDVLAG